MADHDAMRERAESVLAELGNPHRVYWARDFARDVLALLDENARLREALEKVEAEGHHPSSTWAREGLDRQRDPGSSSGRTPGFDPGDAGSTPVPGVSEARIVHGAYFGQDVRVLLARVRELESALNGILTAVEDANRPWQRLEVGAIARAALVDVRETTTTGSGLAPARDKEA